MATLNVGTVLEGRYEIVAPIARGGMSTVYRCTDLRLGRNVAAKVMDDAYVHDPVFRQRFRREARSMAQLSHPNLVGVYDFSSDGDYVFLIMELITGGTLRELLAERGPMPPHAAVAVMTSVLTGLDVAHRKGLVHRDIKPDNVLIGSDHQVKLADFGLVRAASGGGATSNQIVGTVSYLSPEQVTGEEITPASDVYSAGIVLFELLTGETPFTGDTQLAHAYARLDHPVPPPSSRIDGVPQLLDELVATATATDPEERFADAGEFLAAIEDVARELKLPPFTVPVPLNAAAHRASARVEEDQALTDMLTTGFEREQPKERLFPENGTNETSVLPAYSPEPETAAIPVQAPVPVAPAPVAPAPVPQPPAPTAAPKKVSNRGKAGFILWLIAVLVFTAVVAVGAWWYGSGRYGEIPQVVGMDSITAVAAVEEAGFASATSNVYSDEVSKDFSVGTDPAFGDRAVRGDVVTVLVSLGKPTVPDIPASRDLKEFSDGLKERTLNVRNGPQEFSDDVESGKIVRVEPTPGTEVGVGSTVVVHTSKGPAPVTVPSVDGVPEKEAVEMLTELGLKVNVSRAYSSTVAGGDAFETEPPAGTTLPKGSNINLVISTATKIPDVRGRSLSEAKKILADAGVTVSGTTRSLTESGSSKDDVVGTSPEADTLIDSATTSVTLILAGKVSVPNMLGKKLSVARETLTEAGFKVEVTGDTSGSPRVITQSPMYGKLEPGATVSLRVS